MRHLASDLRWSAAGGFDVSTHSTASQDVQAPEPGDRPGAEWPGGSRARLARSSPAAFRRLRGSKRSYPRYSRARGALRRPLRARFEFARLDVSDSISRVRVAVATRSSREARF